MVVESWKQRRGFLVCILEMYVVLAHFSENLSSVSYSITFNNPHPKYITKYVMSKSRNAVMPAFKKITGI